MSNQNEGSFFKLFKFLFEDPNFNDLKPNAKLMYALLTERNNLSVAKTKIGNSQFIDEKGYIYSIYKNKELAKHLKCSEDTVTMLKKLLAEKGLLEEISVGGNLANRLYPKKPYGQYLHQYDIDKYYEIPKSLFFNSRYKSLSTHAKITYALFLDRYKYSLYTKKYIDENKQVYCVLTNEQISKKLGFSLRKIVDIKKELLNFSLISQNKSGFKKAKRTYIYQPENKNDMEPGNLHVWNPEICTYGTRKFARMEPENLHPSDTDLSDTDISDTDFSDLNNMYNLREDNDKDKKANHSSKASNYSHDKFNNISEDQYKKEMSFNKYPEVMFLQLNRLKYDDAKLMMDIINKAKKAVSKEYADMKNEFDFTYESHESEISKVMNLMILKAKFDNISINHLSAYISRSIQNYFRNYAEELLQQIIEEDMSSGNFKI